MVHRKIRKRGKERHLSFFFHRSRESVCVPFICKNMKYIWNSVELFYPWKRVKIPKWSTHIKTLLGPGFGADVKEIHSRTVRKVYGGILSQEQRTCKAAHQWDPLDGKEHDVEEIWFRHTTWNVVNIVPNWMLIFTSYIVNFLYPGTPKCLGSIKTEKVFISEWNAHIW